MSVRIKDYVAEAGPNEPPSFVSDPSLTPLGHCDGRYYFLTPAGELRSIKASEMGDRVLASIFDGDVTWLRTAHPRFNKEGKVSGFNPQSAAEDLMRRCRREGLFDPNTPIRGAGVWREGTGLLVHCGDEILMNGEWIPAGVKRSGVIYPAAPPITRPASDPAGVEAGQKLLEILRMWQFRQPIGPDLILGYIGQAMLGGAPRWRAHAYVRGPRGSGKSWLLDLVAAALGDAAHTPQTDYTEAGLRQALHGEARAILLDESEADGPRGRSRIGRVLELIRHTSGGAGARTVRGSAGGDARSFQVTGSAYMTGILNDPLKPQDRWRVLEVELLPFARGADEASEAERALAAIADVETSSPALRARVIYSWPRFLDSFGAYRCALLAAQCDARQADQIATVLAGRDLLIHDVAPDSDSLAEEVERFACLIEAAHLDDEEGEGEACLAHLYGSPVSSLWRAGELITVGELVLDAFNEAGSGDDARRALGKIGLRLEYWREPERAVLLVANNHPGLKRIFAGERWEQGSWPTALRYLDEAYAWPEPRRFAGVKQRATAIPAPLLPSREERDREESTDAIPEAIDDVRS